MQAFRIIQFKQNRGSIRELPTKKQPILLPYLFFGLLKEYLVSMSAMGMFNMNPIEAIDWAYSEKEIVKYCPSNHEVEPA